MHKLSEKAKMNLERLPDDCFAHILSLTSPIDACRVSLVSPTIRIAADSNNVWEKFLPSDYEDILSTFVHPFVYSSKKELFLRLCNPHLIDGGNKTFSLEKSSGKKCIVLSARELNITWAENSLYWTWKSVSASRFYEVAELRTIWWLAIQGKINSRMLSPDTIYEAYLIVKFADRAYGLDILPSKVSVEIGNHVKSEGTVYLRQHESKKQWGRETIEFSDQMEAVSLMRSMAVRGRDERVPYEREDGWIEIELGSFCNHGDGDDNVEVKMCLKEVTGTHLKGGLVLRGLSLDPKQSYIVSLIAKPPILIVDFIPGFFQ